MGLIDLLKEWNMASIMFRIVLAIILGGMVGIERGKKHRPAGMRTYILVCLGAALVMMTNQYVYVTYGIGDPVRLGAQVISGIGFYEGAILGGVSILFTISGLQKFDNWMRKKSKYMELYLEYNGGKIHSVNLYNMQKKMHLR